jgi:hypothetical protein
MLTYTDLITLSTFEERLDFLRTDGKPSELAFDELRFINQRFYNSRRWKNVRKAVIGRDLGYDLGIPGREIYGRVFVHHMNPLIPKDLYLNSQVALDPEFLITTSHATHQMIHFGIPTMGDIDFFIERAPGDTKLW